MGYTSNWADALDKCVSDGSKTAICEFAGEGSFYGDGALSAVRGLAQDGPSMACPICGGRDEGAGSSQPGSEVGDLPDGLRGGAADLH